MSETFHFRTLAVEGCDVVLEVRPTTAGNLCAIPLTRSFFTILLAERGGPPTIDQSLDVSWLQANLDEFVTGVVLERRGGAIYESDLRTTGTRYQIPIQHLQPTVTLRATMRTEALAARFSPGSSDGTTAFDMWPEDPKQASQLLERHDPTEPFGPFPDAATRAIPAILAHLPRWKSHLTSLLCRTTADAQISLSFSDAGVPYRPGFKARIQLSVPSLSTLDGRRRDEHVSTTLLNGTLRPPFADHWFRQYVGADDAAPELMTFIDEREIESPEATYARLARTLEAPAVDALLTREGVFGLMEDVVASRPPKQRPPNHARLGNGVAHPLGVGWAWEAEPQKLLWQRVAVHAVLGAREDARAALEQARASTKRPPPKELKRLIASLDTPA
ncbi:hypothetical protein [Chondromyces crocatus]|uniref:Uncharacterized protein n=1 Tax=Chondromyces crocatus TaxID=52 RepID=A0A0K1EKF9_CHOCO|nr:hypothetical protein [Chondromyces crocatus]AKT41354.1 uncharacterized protein CMC5_055530 [Chondromyces crocatus]